jgi:hypothetical protein
MIHAFGIEKILVIATFNNRSSVQHNDLIGMGDGRQSVPIEKRTLRVSFKSVILGVIIVVEGGYFSLTQ